MLSAALPRCIAPEEAKQRDTWNNSQAAGVTSHIHVGKGSVKTFRKAEAQRAFQTTPEEAK